MNSSKGCGNGRKSHQSVESILTMITLSQGDRMHKRKLANKLFPEHTRPML